MARHRLDDGPRHGSVLVLALILAVLIAMAGLLAVLLQTDTNAPAAVQEETQEQPPIVVAPPTSTAPATPEEVLKSCQAKASTSAHPGLDTATCVGDNALGTIVACAMKPSTCPRPTQGSGMGPNGATAQCIDGTMIYDPNPRTNHTCAIHGGFAKVFD